MLDRLVRPLVRTQIQVLSQTKSASTRLMSMVSQWLGYLGVQANVTQLQTNGGQIQISVNVGKPDQCSDREWTQILLNINQSCPSSSQDCGLTYAQLSPPQKLKVEHLLALVIHAGNPQIEQDWELIRPRLGTFNIDTELLTGIKTALQQPHTLEHLLDNLEPEVAAFVLSRAIGITLLDREINQEEDSILRAIYSAIDTRTSA